MTTTITEYKETEAALQTLREKHSRKFDVSTSKGMTEAREARAEVKGYRVALEAKRKELKAPALKLCQDIDAEAKRISAQLEAIEEPIDAAIKAEENRKENEKKIAEESRRKRYEDALKLHGNVRARVAQLSLGTPGELAELRDFLQTLDYPQDEHATDTRMVIEQALSQVDSLVAAALKREEDDRQREADRAELAKLRAAEEERQRIAAAKRAEDDRVAAEARQKADDEARKIREAEDAKLRAERAKLDAERAEADKKKRAEEEAKQKALAAERAKETAKLEGRQLLQSFVDRFGGNDEFSGLAATIREWLTQPKKGKAK